jgi:hypothetical protein
MERDGGGGSRLGGRGIGDGGSEDVDGKGGSIAREMAGGGW